MSIPKSRKTGGKPDTVYHRFADAMMATLNPPGTRVVRRGHTLEICARIYKQNWHKLSDSRDKPQETPPWGVAIQALNAGLQHYRVPPMNAEQATPLLAILGVHNPALLAPQPMPEQIATLPLRPVRRRVTAVPGVRAPLQPVVPAPAPVTPPAPILASAASPALPRPAWPEEEELPFPKVVHVRLTPEEQEREDARMMAEIEHEEYLDDLAEKEWTSIEFPGSDPWMNRSVRPSREREREGKAQRQRAENEALRATARQQILLDTELTLRNHQKIDWYTDGRLVDSLRFRVSVGELEYCLPGLLDELQVTHDLECADDIYELDVAQVLAAIFSRDPGGVLVHYRATMPEPDGGTEELWSFGSDTNTARTAALRTIHEDWTDQAS